MAITVARARHLQAAGWPNASNTGVPAGTSLTTNNGNLDTTSVGQTIDAFDVVNGAIVVNHANVTIRRCRISSNSFTGIFVSAGVLGTLTIEDTEIGCQNNGGSGIHFDTGADPDVTMRRLNIHSTENGVNANTGLDMRDCWVHDLDPAGADPHTDGLQCPANVDNVTLIHNNFELAAGGLINSCIQMNTSTVDQTDWLVSGNRLILTATAGPSQGAFTVRLPTGDATANNIRFVNNRMTAGVFGYVTPSPPTSHITEWSAVDDITGNPVP